MPTVNEISEDIVVMTQPSTWQSENTAVVDVQPRFKVSTMVKAKFEGWVYVGKMTDHNLANN